MGGQIEDKGEVGRNHQRSTVGSHQARHAQLIPQNYVIDLFSLLEDAYPYHCFIHVHFHRLGQRSTTSLHTVHINIHCMWVGKEVEGETGKMEMRSKFTHLL